MNVKLLVLLAVFAQCVVATPLGKKAPKTSKPNPRAVLPKDSLLCPSLTTYVEATYHSSAQPKSIQKFQMLLGLSFWEEKNALTVDIQHWNNTLAPTLLRGVGSADNWCDYDCTHDGKQIASMNIHFQGTKKYDIQCPLFDVERVGKRFRLDKVVGKCAKYQIKDECYYGFRKLIDNTRNHDSQKLTDNVLYNLCICCGSQYAPEPSLKCPRM